MDSSSKIENRAILTRDEVSNAIGMLNKHVYTPRDYLEGLHYLNEIYYGQLATTDNNNLETILAGLLIKLASDEQIVTAIKAKIRYELTEIDNQLNSDITIVSEHAFFIKALLIGDFYHALKYCPDERLEKSLASLAFNCPTMKFNSALDRKSAQAYLTDIAGLDFYPDLKINPALHSPTYWLLRIAKDCIEKNNTPLPRIKSYLGKKNLVNNLLISDEKIQELANDLDKPGMLNYLPRHIQPHQIVDYSGFDATRLMSAHLPQLFTIKGTYKIFNWNLARQNLPEYDALYRDIADFILAIVKKHNPDSMTFQNFHKKVLDWLPKGFGEQWHSSSRDGNFTFTKTPQLKIRVINWNDTSLPTQQLIEGWQSDECLTVLVGYFRKLPPPHMFNNDYRTNINSNFASEGCLVIQKGMDTYREIPQILDTLSPGEILDTSWNKDFYFTDWEFLPVPAYLWKFIRLPIEKENKPEFSSIPLDEFQNRLQLLLGNDEKITIKNIAKNCWNAVRITLTLSTSAAKRLGFGLDNNLGDNQNIILDFSPVNHKAQNNDKNANSMSIMSARLYNGAMSKQLCLLPPTLFDLKKLLWVTSSDASSVESLVAGHKGTQQLKQYFAENNFPKIGDIVAICTGHANSIFRWSARDPGVDLLYSTIAQFYDFQATFNASPPLAALLMEFQKEKMLETLNTIVSKISDELKDPKPVINNDHTLTIQESAGVFTVHTITTNIKVTINANQLLLLAYQRLKELTEDISNKWITTQLYNEFMNKNLLEESKDPKDPKKPCQQITIRQLVEQPTSLAKLCIQKFGKESIQYNIQSQSSLCRYLDSFVPKVFQEIDEKNDWVIVEEPKPTGSPQ